MSARGIRWAVTIRVLAACGAVVLAVGACTGDPAVLRSGPAAAGPPGLEGVLEDFADLPLGFVANRGQTDPEVRFYAQGPRYGFFLTSGGIALSFAGEHRDASGPRVGGLNLDLTFLRANPAVKMRAEGALPGEVNYFLGNDPAGWQTGLARSQRVVYADLWPGVDLALQGAGGELKYEFRVEPGARPADIRLGYSGADGLVLDESGELLIDTPLGVLRDAAPQSYQVIAGRRVPVESRYVLANGLAGYGFAVGDYDPRYELVIDPALDYSTFLGGVVNDFAAGITTDAAGNAYVVGTTYSATFPTTAGAFDTSRATEPDVFVTKLNATGSALVYSTYLGGTPTPVPAGGSDPFEFGRGIAVDTSGNAYVTGQTTSSDFPTTSGAFDRSINVSTFDATDAFVTKLNATGSSLVYSTFFGGTDIDDGLSIGIDGSGNAYVSGQTASNNLPTTSGAIDTSANGGNDAFATKFNSAGSGLVYSTYLGGTDNEMGSRVLVDGAGNAYVGGSTRSAGFPTTPGAFDTSANGGFDAFATKLNANGTALLYSTFVGGGDVDFGDGLAIDGAGNAYVSGGTISSNFPTTPGAFDTSLEGGSDAFVAKLNAAGSALAHSTLLGGSDGEGSVDVVVDGTGNAWVTGGTSSPDFPTTPDALAGDFNGGGADAYVTEVNAAGSALVYSTFLGGSDSENGRDLAFDTAGNVYVTGQTFSADFPTTPGAFDATFGGNPGIFIGDAFVTKLELDGEPPPPVPAVPMLLSPANGARVAQPITFDWTDVANAASYTIQIDDSSAFTTPLVREATVTTSSFTTSGLASGRHWWRVRAVNSAGVPGDWSAVRNFRPRPVRG